MAYLLSFENLERGFITVGLIVSGTLIIRWTFSGRLSSLRSPAAFIVYSLAALILLNTLGAFFIPHSMWIFIPFLLLGGSIGVGTTFSFQLNRMLGGAGVLLGLLGFGMRSESVHFWLNAYAPGQFGAWQLVQILSDVDGDGFTSILGGKDCAPLDSEIHPSRLEWVGNGVDETCGGWDLATHSPYPESAKPVGRFANDLKRPNVIFITVDAVRADAVNEEVTPVINELASFGQYFERVYTPAPHTNESLPAAMSGMYPSDWHQNGVFFGIQPTFATQMASLGYDTSAVLCFPGMDQVVISGFDYVDNSLGLKASKNSFEVTGPQSTELALARIDEVKDGQFFLWVHYFDPHMPLIPGATPVGSGLMSAYKQEIYRTDQAIGSLLEGLVDRDLLNDTVLVVFSDHGEGLNEHRVLTHGWGVWESLVRVPLIFRFPGMPAMKSNELASVVDIVPTLFDYLGVVDGGYRRGVSLLPAMLGESLADRPIFLESNYTAPSGLVRGVVRGKHKFIFDIKRASYGLFDVIEDPAEANNLIEKEPELAKEMRHELELWWKTTHNDVALKEKGKVWDSRIPKAPSKFVGDVGVTYEGGMGIPNPKKGNTSP